jgi:hypothetical protein
VQAQEVRQSLICLVHAASPFIEMEPSPAASLLRGRDV